MSYTDDYSRFVAAFTPDPDQAAKAQRRRNLRTLLIVAAVVWALIGLALSPVSDVRAAGASQSFAAWYNASPENRFHYWYASDERNAGYYHIREHFGHGRLGDQAVRVAQCESELRPSALNRSSGASGLFQVMPSWRSRYGQVTGQPYYDDRFNPDANARFAAWLVHETGGWSHWSCRS